MIIKIKNESLFNIQRDSGVYLIRCISKNRIYIGSTNQSFRARFSNHCKFLMQGIANMKLQDDYNECGHDDFEFEILGVYSEEECVKYEQYYMNKLNPYYNVHKAFNNSKTNLNRKFSKEHKLKLSEKASLHTHDDETWNKLCKLNKENSSQYKTINVSTNKYKIRSAVQCDKFFKSGHWRKHVDKSTIYKGRLILKLKKQAKSITLVDSSDNKFNFNSYEECDRFLNKWRGFTSTNMLKKVTTIDGYKVLIE